MEIDGVKAEEAEHRVRWRPLKGTAERRKEEDMSLKKGYSCFWWTCVKKKKKQMYKGKHKKYISIIIIINNQWWEMTDHFTCCELVIMIQVITIVNQVEIEASQWSGADKIQRFWLVLTVQITTRCEGTVRNPPNSPLPRDGFNTQDKLGCVYVSVCLNTSEYVQENSQGRNRNLRLFCIWPCGYKESPDSKLHF